MFHKILIANRGEIACRVIKTARKMGIATVAVYSDADRDAQHVTLADEAIGLGPAPSRESYLVVEKILQAAKQSGAQAIHPGYGFLSENAEFARRVEEEGLVFIGPKHGAIAAMGDKIASKRLAMAAGVSTIPGHNEAIASVDEALRIAQTIGYPVMVKASAGGGGKGLRVAFNDAELRTGYAACRNEARNSFGDDRVFIEKFVKEPRHIEIQVLADAHGHCVFLWERECSIQRRHQKVIEEAPSPFLDEPTRQAMGAQAVALARAVDYQSAGTVEFVVAQDKSFYFLEMNTRLQVEHPVTECITGIDLVEQMIRVAAGEPLAFGQADIARRGWAIECRINAEDPARNFLPSTGRLVRYETPAVTLHAADEQTGQFGVRIDSGVAEGGEISMHYDAMIAKLITYGADRSDALARMREALNAFAIRGIRSNLPFQSALLNHPRFISGDFHTGFIAEYFPQGYQSAEGIHPQPDFMLALAAAVHRRLLERATGISGQLPGHEFQIGSAFVVFSLRPSGPALDTPVHVQSDGELIRVTLNEQTHTLRLFSNLRQLVVHGEFNGQPFCAQVERMGLNFRLTHQGVVVDTRVLSPSAARLSALMPIKQPPDLSKFLLSPMPGLLTEIAVQSGQTVQPGEKLAVIEAMKMENLLLAETEGVVDKVLASPGESLAVDQPILSFK